MAERDDSDREVLTSLPRSRPVRRSAKRGDRATTDAGAKAPPARRSGAKATQAASAGAKAKPKPARARPKASAGAPRRAESAAERPRATAGGSAKRAAERPRATAGGSAKRAAERPRTGPPRKVPPAGYAVPRERADEPASSGAAELIGTTIQAAAELAQIGMAVGRQTLQSMLDRLPKP